MTETFTISAALWIWTSDKAPASWHFITIEGDVAEAIHATAIMRRMESGRRRGWGSIKVSAKIGDTQWDTSIFPAFEGKGWLLPIKVAVRKAEGLVVGGTATVQLTL
jgi:hypothetical protein